MVGGFGNAAIELISGCVGSERHGVSDVARVIKKNIIAGALQDIYGLVLVKVSARAHVVATCEGDEHFVDWVSTVFMNAQADTAASACVEVLFQQIDLRTAYAGEGFIGHIN